MRRILVSLFLIVFSASVVAQDKPNILILLSDNLGYGDIGIYGGGGIRGAETPRIDALAQEGMRLTNFNVELTCTPSRSALLTGRYAVRSGTTIATPTPGLPQGLAPWETTLAETLKDEGYDTALFGKWHLGASKGRFPTDQGFDKWWGFPNSTGLVNFSRSVGFPEGQIPKFYLLEGEAGKGVKPTGEYNYESRRFIDESIQQKSIEYLEQRNEDNPFFLVVSWSLVHHPSIPHPDFEGRSTAGRYGDVMLEHDHRVGEVLEALDRLDLEKDTIVIYASDNGPDRAEYPWIGDTGPFRGYLGSSFEGSVRTPMMIRWPNKIKPDQVSNEIVAIHDIFPTLAAITGADVPDDRPIDGVDQSDFFLGETEKSARESVLFFRGNEMSALKWRSFKVHFQGENPHPRETDIDRMWTPKIFHVEVDPKESNDITHQGYLWMFSIIRQLTLPFQASIEEHGMVPTGGEKPGPGNVQMPFGRSFDSEEARRAANK
ncbi:MAG: sulfatase-like hydrolase/transferase [Pseudomonadales bacterium]|nr:sulfatase-like hydrolase/transferase [Pseudomonadales bacterium]